MPNRIIREAILSSESVSKLSWAEEVFYRRLMSIVDDHGRFEASPQLIRARCYPLQTDEVKASEVSKWLETCSHHGLIVLYAVDGKRYLEVVKFQQQTRSVSKCPAPDINCYQVPATAHLDVVVSVVEGVAEKETAPEGDLLSGIDKQVAKDFKALRTKLRAPITKTALAGIEREAKIAGLTVEQALTVCCERNWRGFKADWLKDKTTNGAAAHAELPGGGRRAL